MIGAVGSTGDSTGPHLHLEVMLNGEYLNPYYFVETGGSGENVGPVVPDYSGEPMSSDRFQAMLAEAEKYLGYLSYENAGLFLQPERLDKMPDNLKALQRQALNLLTRVWATGASEKSVDEKMTACYLAAEQAETDVFRFQP